MSWILYILLAIWVLPKLLRWLLPRPPTHGGPRGGPTRRSASRQRRRPAGRPRDPLRDLTQQEITDADYEEIPPEE